jgi:hypothetical protein
MDARVKPGHDDDGSQRMAMERADVVAFSNGGPMRAGTSANGTGPAALMLRSPRSGRLEV